MLVLDAVEMALTAAGVLIVLAAVFLSLLPLICRMMKWSQLICLAIGFALYALGATMLWVMVKLEATSLECATLALVVASASVALLWQYLKEGLEKTRELLGW